jgi:hypothetical protein
MDKLKDLVTGTSGGPRAILLLGGTMRPTELLHRGLTSVCALPEERIVEFSCGHVVAESNLLALSIGLNFRPFLEIKFFIYSLSFF